MHKSSIENQGNLAKPMLGDVYREVLNLYLSKDEFREAMQTPIIQLDYVIATDAHRLICFKKDLLTKIDFESHPKAPNALSVIPTENNVCIEFNVSNLRKSITKSNKDFSKKYKVEITECPDCDGNGFVGYEFTDYKRKRHQIENECPTCESETEFTKITDLETGDELETAQELLKYGNTHFVAEYFETMVETAEMLGIDKIQIVSKNSDTSIHKFQVGECVVCLVPVNLIEDESVVTNIA